MKKRIISLALVIVMTLLTLCSCSFNYAKRDLSKYAKFDSAAFENALLSLVIADGDFGTDEETRKIKVLDTIFAALATDAGTDNKVTEGTAGKYDVLYYGYYVTLTKTVTEKLEDGTESSKEVTYTLMNDGMNPAKPGSVQFGLSDTEGLAALIEALVGTTDIKDYVYTANAEGTTELGDTVYVSYTKTYSVPVLDENGEPELDASGDPKYESKTETVNYGIVTLPSTPPANDSSTSDEVETTAEGDTNEETTDDNTTGDTNEGDTTKPTIVKTFLDNLVGQKIGKVSDYKVEETIDGETYEVTYSGIQLHWIVENAGVEIGTVEDKTYTTTKKVKDVNGVEHELKDETLVYHVFPMYIVDVVDELTPEIVLEKLYGTDSDKDGTVEDSEKGSLELLTSEEYKNGEETLKSLVEQLVTKYNELAKLDKALTTAKDKAEEEADKNDSATEDETEDSSTDSSTEGENTDDGASAQHEGDETTEDTTEDTEQTDLEKAQADYDEKLAEVNELVAKVVAATNGEKTVGEVLVTEYTDAVYDNLETSYKSTIKSNLAKEVFELAEKYITFTGNLPKRAVKDAYERIENIHKYNFYQGNYNPTGNTSSSSTVTNYAFYEGNYETYLKVALGLKETDSMDTAEATMTAQAEAAVKELIIVYTLADYYGEAVELTKEQKKSVKNNIYVVYLGVSEEDFTHALQFDNIMNYILEEKAEEDYTEDAEYGENKVQYKRLSYTFEVEDETEGDTESGTEDGTESGTEDGTESGTEDGTESGTEDGTESGTEDETENG